MRIAMDKKKVRVLYLFLYLVELLLGGCICFSRYHVNSIGAFFSRLHFVWPGGCICFSRYHVNSIGAFFSRLHFVWPVVYMYTKSTFDNLFPPVLAVSQQAIWKSFSSDFDNLYTRISFPRELSTSSTI